MQKTKERQISLRISAAADQWLERRSRRTRSKASVIRELIEAEMAKSREQELLSMFNAAAADLTVGDRKERERLLNALTTID